MLRPTRDQRIVKVAHSFLHLKRTVCIAGQFIFAFVVMIMNISIQQHVVVCSCLRDPRFRIQRYRALRCVSELPSHRSAQDLRDLWPCTRLTGNVSAPSDRLSESCFSSCLIRSLSSSSILESRAPDKSKISSCEETCEVQSLRSAVNLLFIESCLRTACSSRVNFSPTASSGFTVMAPWRGFGQAWATADPRIRNINAWFSLVRDSVAHRDCEEVRAEGLAPSALRSQKPSAGFSFDEPTAIHGSK